MLSAQTFTNSQKRARLPALAERADPAARLAADQIAAEAMPFDLFGDDLAKWVAANLDRRVAVLAQGQI